MKITLENMKKLKVERLWFPDDVRQLCINERYYINGDVEDYNAMLEFVKDHRPDYETMYLVAADIFHHSDRDSISGIMCSLESEAVKTIFHVNGE